VSNVEGYFIRRENWLSILEENKEIGYLMQRNILIEYFVKVRGKMCAFKRVDLEKFISRHDYNQICAV